jgi:uncharacterized protein YndB with AHSA1/START domain
MSETNRTFGVIESVQEVVVNAPPERVWKALTEQLSAWWPKEYYAGKSPRGFLLDLQLGGKLYESWGAGQGLVWGTVTAIRVNERLDYVGHLDPDFGGPANTRTRYALEADGDATRVRVSEVHWGGVTDESRACVESGWGHLLADCLKPFVETGAQPDIPDTVDV